MNEELIDKVTEEVRAAFSGDNRRIGDLGKFGIKAAQHGLPRRSG